MIDKNANTTDATRGSSLRIRVETRKRELELALDELPPDDRARPDIQLALSEVGELLTGNLDEIPYVVAAALNTWLEANKHINERQPEPMASTTEPMASTQH
jgi:hypothetical protein